MFETTLTDRADTLGKQREEGRWRAEDLATVRGGRSCGEGPGVQGRTSNCGESRRVIGVRTLVGMTQDLFAQDEDAQEPEVSPRRRWRRPALIVLGGAAVLLVGGLVVSLMYLNSLANTYEESVQTFDETFPEDNDRPDRPERVETDEDGNETVVEDESINVLVIGSDEGGGSGVTEDLPMVPNAGRADTMMLVHIPHERDSIQVMSIMRDTWTEIPGHGHHKINASFSLGGVPLAVQTVESLFEVPIDHVAAMDMLGFQNLVGTMGGVTVDSPVAFTSREGYTYSEGSQHMSPEKALSFVRERHAFEGSGDYQRAANQQAFMGGVLNDVLQPATFTSPARIHDIVEDFAPHMTVDEDLADPGHVAGIGWEMRNIRGGDIDMFTLPNGGVGEAGGQSVIWPDEEAIAEAGEALQNGEFADYAAQH